MTFLPACHISAFPKHFAFSIDIVGSSTNNNKRHPSVTHCKVQVRGIGCLSKCSHFAEGKSKTSESEK